MCLISSLVLLAYFKSRKKRMGIDQAMTVKKKKKKKASLFITPRGLNECFSLQKTEKEI